jgi:hypothetical protein
VPAGTNGAVSLLSVSALGGLFQGLVSFFYAYFRDSESAASYADLVLPGLFAS